MATVVASSTIVDQLLSRGVNYDEWRDRVRTYLLTQDLWRVIEDTEENHEIQVINNDWNRKNIDALHAIKISCGSEALLLVKGVDSAKNAWEILAANFMIDDPYKPLYLAVRRGDLGAVKKFIDEDPPALKATIYPENDFNVLHVAVLAGHDHIVEELVGIMSKQDLEMKNGGVTALAYVAIYGSIRMAEAMVKKNKGMLGIPDKDGFVPVSVAFSYGRNRMALYLYHVTPYDVLISGGGTVAVTIITQSIKFQKNYDIVFDLLQRNPTLTLAKDVYNETPFQGLSSLPQAFPSGCRLIFWQKWIYNVIHIEADNSSTKIDCISAQVLKNEQSIERKIFNSVCIALERLLKFLQYSGYKHIYEMKRIHVNSLELLEFMCKQIRGISFADSYSQVVLTPVCRAVCQGTIELFREVLKSNPEIVFCSNELSRNMVVYAIENRQEEIYNLIYGFDNKEALTSDRDKLNNNILHIVGKLGPSAQLDRISGAALQMQRELQWFKEVEKVVPPAYIESQNSDFMTPREVFTNNHKQLVIEGQKWMKETATSCTIAGALIVTIMFTAIFTVPGGYDGNSGSPIFLNEKKLMIFIISDAISLFASTTSVLFFLGILTSRYAEEDFYKSLPTKLIIGLSTLFFSIAAMMVAFCTALFIIVEDKHWVFIPVIMLASVPVMSFAYMQFPYLVEIFKSTYGKGIFHRKRSPLFK